MLGDLDLGAVEGDVAELDEARPAVQGHSAEQPRQRPEVTLAEVADRAEVRLLQARHRREVVERRRQQPSLARSQERKVLLMPRNESHFQSSVEPIPISRTGS